MLRGGGHDAGTTLCPSGGHIKMGHAQKGVSLLGPLQRLACSMSGLMATQLQCSSCLSLLMAKHLCPPVHLNCAVRAALGWQQPAGAAGPPWTPLLDFTGLSLVWIPALQRIYIALPEEKARAHMFKVHLGDTPHNLTQQDFMELAKRTEGFSGSDVNVVVKDVLMEPVRMTQEAEFFM